MYTEINDETINVERINKNRTNYLKIYRATHSEDKRYNKHSYNKKLYHRKLAEKEKRRIDSNFAFRGKNIRTKEYLLIIVLLIFTCILLMFTEDYQDQKLVSFYIILFFIWSIALVYNVNSAYYYMFLIIYIVFLLFSSYLYKSYEREELKLFDNKLQGNKSNSRGKLRK